MRPPINRKVIQSKLAFWKVQPKYVGDFVIPRCYGDGDLPHVLGKNTSSSWIKSNFNCHMG